MHRQVRSLATLAVVICSLSVGLALAQGKQVEPAPIPTQIGAAKRVFIANAGGDEPTSYYELLFNGGVDRSYNQFYAGIKSAGRYELVGSPAEADLIFQIGFAVHPSAFHGDKLTASYDPQFRLEIRDPKTNVLLWAFTEHMEWAILQGNRNRNFDQASARVVADALALGTRATGVATQAKQ